jgi:hypothetical protein
MYFRVIRHVYAIRNAGVADSAASERRPVIWQLPHARNLNAVSEGLGTQRSEEGVGESVKSYEAVGPPASVAASQI